MANSLYDKGREGFLDGSISWASDTIKVAGVSASYTPNLATDANLSDVPGGDIVATTGALSAKTETGGVANAASATFAAVTGAAITRLVIYKDTGTGSTSRLIACIDTGTGLPVTPNGGDITVAWDTGANKIFRL